MQWLGLTGESTLVIFCFADSLGYYWSYTEKDNLYGPYAPHGQLGPTEARKYFENMVRGMVKQGEKIEFRWEE